MANLSSSTRLIEHFLTLWTFVSRVGTTEPVKRIAEATALCLAALIFGCATTHSETTGNDLSQPLCQSKVGQFSALVLWGPVWRANQKDVPLREEAALRGIEDFAKTCFGTVTIRRLEGGRLAETPTDEQIRVQAANEVFLPDSVLVVIVHELGPVIQILGPVAAFGGGTEVVLELQTRDPASGKQIVKLQTRWHNGGSFVIKSTKTLPQDMRSALQAALTSAQSQ
jgi:hypothetical protein